MRRAGHWAGPNFFEEICKSFRKDLVLVTTVSCGLMGLGLLGRVWHRAIMRHIYFTGALIVTSWPLQALGIDLVSQSDDLVVTQLDRLPRNSSAPVHAVICGAVLPLPESREGREIAAKGWGVTAGLAVNGVTLISFVGQAEAGTSAMCRVSDGNVATFQAGQVTGLIYGQTGWRRSIGSVEAREGGLRLWSGDVLPVPLADLRLLGTDLIVVSPVSGSGRFCKGAVSVPNLYGIPIHRAHRLLLDRGWVPEAAAEPLFQDRMSFGLTEAQGCSGTGANFCGFGYRNEDSAQLTVTTAGEAEAPNSPAVVDIQVICTGTKVE